IRGSATRIASHRKRPQGIAMITLVPRNEPGTPRFIALDKKLTRHLQCRFDAFRTARDKVHMVQTFRRIGGQFISKHRGRLVGKKTGMRIGKPINLGVQGRQNPGMLMTEARYGSAARRIDVTIAVVVEKYDAFATQHSRVIMVNTALKNMSHGRTSNIRY